jgi:hypothetical protein
MKHISYILNVVLLLGLLGFIYYIFIIKDINNPNIENNYISNEIDSLNQIIRRYEKIESDINFIQTYLFDSIEVLTQTIYDLEAENQFKDDRIGELIETSKKSIESGEVPIIINDYAMIDTTRPFVIYTDKETNGKWLIYIDKGQIQKE